MMQDKMAPRDAQNANRKAEWHCVRMRVEDFEYLKHAAKRRRSATTKSDRGLFRRGKISRRITSVQMPPQALRESELTQELANQLDPRERRQPTTAEAQRKIPVDTSMQVSFSLSHDSWPFGWSEERLEHPLQTTPRGPIQAERRLGLITGSPSAFSEL